MVKQFTIPCQFGQETSPVTLYIGHPESTHHPIKFQSDWLSSAKGGTVPQDLMDTLQKLHDLAQENGADFEELCYYALISATQHSSGGVSPDDINKYADEFVQKEGNVDMAGQAFTDNNQTADSSENHSKDDDIKEAEKVFNTSVAKTSQQQEEINQTLQELGGISQDNIQQEDKNKIQPTLNAINQSAMQNTHTTADMSTMNSENKSDDLLLSETYSQEDEDMLLDDDLSEF